MPNAPEETISAPDPAFNGLNKADKEETEAILKEIEDEAPKPADEKPADVPKPEEAQPAEGETKPEEAADGKPDAKADKNEARRTPGLMPTWAHEAYKDKTTKEIAQLQTDLAAARGTAANGPEGNGAQKPDAPTGDALEKEAQAIAEKHGISVELATDLISTNARLSGIDDIKARLGDIDSLKATHEAEVETAKFNADFDRIILPALKAEYGDEIPSEVISKVRDELKDLAYDPEGTYAKVPYITIFKGEDRFRDLIPPLKRGVEPSRPGATAAAGAEAADQVDLTKPLSDDVIRTLSNEHFDTYMKNMETYERSLAKK